MIFKDIFSVYTFKGADLWFLNPSEIAKFRNGNFSFTFFKVLNMFDRKRVSETIILAL